MSGNGAGLAAASSIVGDVLNFGGGLIQGARNRRATRKENQRQRDWANQMFDKQNQRDIEFWNMQNAYNDPLAQMERLKNAGLNPNLVYGNGADAQSGPIATHSAPTPNTRAEQHENIFAPLGNVVGNYLTVRQQQANISRTQAETKAIEAQTTNTQFENQLKQHLGLDHYARRESLANEKLSVGYQRELADWEAFKIAGFGADGHVNATHGYSIDKNSPAVKAQNAGLQRTIQELENAKSLGDIRTFEASIKQFEASLASQGISPNSPWYAKIVADLISHVMGVNLRDIGTGIGKAIINQ